MEQPCSEPTDDNTHIVKKNEGENNPHKTSMNINDFLDFSNELCSNSVGMQFIYVISSLRVFETN